MSLKDTMQQMDKDIREGTIFSQKHPSDDSIVTEHNIHLKAMSLPDDKGCAL